MARIKNVMSALLGLVAVSLVVRCGDDEDDEDEKRSKLSSNTYAQETISIRSYPYSTSLQHQSDDRARPDRTVNRSLRGRKPAHSAHWSWRSTGDS